MIWINQRGFLECSCGVPYILEDLMKLDFSHAMVGGGWYEINNVSRQPFSEESNPYLPGMIIPGRSLYMSYHKTR